MNLSPNALFGFCALVLCKATMKQFTMDFLKGKMVATAYLTFQPYSKLQCVNQCSTKDLCQIAEYNTVTKTYRLSADIPDNLTVLDVADDSVGVIFLPKGKIYAHSLVDHMLKSLFLFFGVSCLSGILTYISV